MRTCKVRPDASTCDSCEALAEFFGEVPKCWDCKADKDVYELVQIGSSFWSGEYGMVLKDGKIRKVPLSRVYDITEQK